jgi:molecular chaperone Hsp33
MNDYLIKALAFDGQIRAYAVTTTGMVSEAQKRHDTWPTASAALGRAMTASTMMGMMLKGENNSVTVKIEGGGPIGLILVDSNTKGETRGYVTNPHTHFESNSQGKLDVARAVGKDGFLSVLKDIGMREKFTGQVPLVSGELGDDFTYYFASSEQVPSAVGVGVLVNPDYSIKASGGFIIQVMPGAADAIVDLLDERIKAIPPISRLIEQGMTPEDILYQLLGEDQVKILEKSPIRFQCTCSHERFGKAIVSLGEKEIKDIIEEDGQAETNCQFCNESYTFTKEELTELLNQAKQ